MASPISSGLRSLRIPALRLCRPRLAAYPLLARSLSTSLPRYTPVAQALSVADVDVSKPVSAVEEQVVDERVPFASLAGKVSKKTLDAITVRPMKHTHMTSVQEAVLSMLPELSNPLKQKEDGSFEDLSSPRDLMVRAKTGTGKTLAFLVPAIESRVKQLEQAGKEAEERAGSASDRRLVEKAKNVFAHTHVGALILSPTRELASQIVVEAERLSTHHGFEVHKLIGGESKGMQLRKWHNSRKDIVVATTGRLRDLLETKGGILEEIRTTKFLILDEADTMLDMGFGPDVEAITPELPRAPERQTFVFSATIKPAIQQIARRALSKNHVFINTVSDTDSPVHAHIPQYHTVLSSAADQLPHTLRLIAHDQLVNPGTSKVIVFLPTTKLTQLYSTLIRELARSVLPAGRDTTVYEIHSKRSMDSRSKTSDRFRKDTSGACVLITSDVSARGVDYPGVTRVIQLGIPGSSEQYIHRVGRTGRVGSTQGRGDLVLLPWEHGFIREELSHVPLKPVTSTDLEKQVHEIAERHDEDPKAFFPVSVSSTKARTRFPDRQRPALSRYSGRVKVRLQAMKEEIDEVLSSAVEEDEVRETFSSMLGFYVGKSSELRTTRNAILEGLREWAVQAGGLPEPPYVSEAFLNKIGFSTESKREKFSRGGGFVSKSSSRPQNRWDGRGSRESKFRQASGSRGADSERRAVEEWRPRRDSESKGWTERSGGRDSYRSENRGGRPAYDGASRGGRSTYGGESRGRSTYDGENRGRRSSSEGESRGRRSTWPGGRDD